LPIDVKTPLSDGWWLNKLARQLTEQARECEELHCRFRGRGPLPKVHRNAEDVVREFLEKARTNYERIIVQGPLSRMQIVGIRTSAGPNSESDSTAFGAWTAANMKLVVRETLKSMFAMRVGYVIVGKDAAGKLLVTAEDPRQVTAIVDPADPYSTLAALKLTHDDVNDQDLAYLYMDGRVRVAVRNRKARPVPGGAVAVTFSPTSFDWDDTVTDESDQITHQGRSGPTGIPGNSVHVFENEDGQAEFEPHIPLLDRITDGLVQRMTIALAQAFRQRAIKGVAVTDPATGQKVNYDDLLRADPMSVWLLPAGAEMWESSETTMQGVVLAGRDDERVLAAVSCTPLYSFSPDAAQGSAEGASLQREALTFKTLAHIERVDPGWERVAAQVLGTAGITADRTTLDIIWAPVERFSLAVRASAVAQTKGVVPRRTQLTDIMGYSPTDANRMMSELTDDLILDQQYAAGLKAATATGNANSTA
jgi:hypothetical protein